MNPVLVTLALFTTIFGCAGFWVFASALTTRKVDTKVKNVDAATDLEEASREYRKEIAVELTATRRRFSVFTAVVIPLLRTIDHLAPKAVSCWSPDEQLIVHTQVDAVWKAIEP